MTFKAAHQRDKNPGRGALKRYSQPDQTGFLEEMACEPHEASLKNENKGKTRRLADNKLNHGWPEFSSLCWVFEFCAPIPLHSLHGLSRSAEFVTVQVTLMTQCVLDRSSQLGNTKEVDSGTDCPS